MIHSNIYLMNEHAKRAHFMRILKWKREYGEVFDIHYKIHRNEMFSYDWKNPVKSVREINRAEKRFIRLKKNLINRGI